MRPKLFLIVAFFLLAIVFLPISCGRENPINVEIITEPEQFPMSVGMYWKYEIYDSLTDQIDTMQVSIVDSTHDRCGRVMYRWNYYNGDSVYTYFWAMVGDSLMRFDDALSLSPIELILFPLELNKGWRGPLQFSDSGHVSDSGSLTTPAGEFETAFRIDWTWNRDFEGGRDSSSTWLVPGVGLAQLSQYKCYSDGHNITITKNLVWSLIDYNLYTFSINDFPHTVGSYWIYEYGDSINSIVKTVRVSIVDHIIVSEQDVSVWQYDYGDRVDTQYAFVSGNTIAFHDDTIPHFSNASYLFPFALGRFWGMDFFVPPSGIFEKGAISVPAGQFPNGFRHIFYSYGFNYGHWLDEWLVPGVGVVKRAEYIMDIGLGIVVTYDLLEYHIAP